MRRLWAVAVLVLAGCAPREGNVPADKPGTYAARRDVWTEIKAQTEGRGLDPGFVYAIVKIESNFDAHAKRGDARGLLQLKPTAWKAVSREPYSTGVWDWRKNLKVGIDSLALMKVSLERKGVFSYPLLWACYHYGYDFVAAHGFDMSRIPRPSDPVSYKLFAGQVHPLPPPE